MTSRKLVIYAIGGLTKNEPYIQKLFELLESTGLELDLRVWSRQAGVEKTLQISSNARIQVLYRNTAKTRVTKYFGYLVWVGYIFFDCIKTARSQNVAVFCSRFESALPVFLATQFSKFPYVYLDRDAIHLTHNWPRYLASLLRFIEIRIGRNAALHVIPGESRRYHEGGNVRVVQNSPSSKTVEEADACETDYMLEGLSTSCKKVYVNGWLPSTRGVRMILEAAQYFKRNPTGSAVVFVVAGDPGCPEAEELIGLENVVYLGRLDSRVSLALYREMDVVLAFYDPSIAINRKAEPNKWFDCAMMKVPFITNKGIETVEPWVGGWCAAVVEYGDGEGLANAILETLGRDSVTDGDEYLGGPRVEAWDVQMRVALGEIIG